MQMQATFSGMPARSKFKKTVSPQDNRSPLEWLRMTVPLFNPPTMNSHTRKQNRGANFANLRTL